jgi:hypothetical protein
MVQSGIQEFGKTARRNVIYILIYVIISLCSYHSYLQNKTWLTLIKKISGQGCNPSYKEGGDQQDYGSRPVWFKNL